MMSSDFRYHIASLSAVFLALGIGLLAGMVLIGTPFVGKLDRRIEQQETMIKDLDRRARGQEGNEEALKVLIPRLTAGALIGREVLVVQAGDDPVAADAAAVTIEKAGGSVRRLALPDDAWSGLESLERDRQTRLLAQTLHGNMDASLQMTDALVIGDLPPATARRVIIAGSTPTHRERDQRLAQFLRDDGCIVVGVETLTAEPSAGRTFQAIPVSFVDCIDRAAGQIALTRAVLGDKGWFGLKPGAEHVLPAIFAERSGSASPQPSPSPTP
jgi:hypothetical protein